VARRTRTARPAAAGYLLGKERTVLPLLAERDFHLAAYTAALTYILAFGATKAVTNFFAGTLSDRYDRKPVLLAGPPVPLLLIWAPSWGRVVAANVLLGVNQGLAWSTTVIMKIDLAGPDRRGLAMGLNEAAGYLALAGTAAATGALAAQWRLNLCRLQSQGICAVAAPGSTARHAARCGVIGQRGGRRGRKRGGPGGLDCGGGDRRRPGGADRG
jgi:MFS family permease